MSPKYANPLKFMFRREFRPNMLNKWPKNKKIKKCGQLTAFFTEGGVITERVKYELMNFDFWSKFEIFHDIRVELYLNCKQCVCM